MFDLLIAAVCGLIALALLFGLMCMAVLLLVKRWAAEEEGPWVVIMPYGHADFGGPTMFLTLLTAGQWGQTLLLGYAERFPRKHDAEEWACVVGGRVVAEREVGS